MKKPAISVVIPCYNEEKYLATCLQSLKKQMFTDFEIIVVDNNCTDRTAQVARSYGARVETESLQGMIPARERGFAEARADIIARTDADTIVSPLWLAQIHEVFSQHSRTVALCCGVTFPDVAWPFSTICQYVIIPSYYHLSRLVYGHYPLMGPNSAIRRSAWKKVSVHVNDRQVHEDLDLACHLNEVGEIAYCPQITTTYSMRRWRRRFWYTLAEYTVRYMTTLLLHNHKYLRYQRRYRKIRSKIKKTVELAALRVRS